MIKRLLLLTLIVSCSSKPDLLREIKSNSPIDIKSIHVDSKLEALKYIQNQRNYLVLLFEQTREPYYGTPKWNDQCLKDNRIGVIFEDEKVISLKSRLYFDSNGSPGFCFENRPPYFGQQVIYYCKNQNKVHNLKFNSTSDIDLKAYNLCD